MTIRLFLVGFILLTANFLNSCKEEGKSSQEPVALPDSIVIEHYSDWSSKCKYIESYNYDKTLLARTEVSRDTLFLKSVLDNNLSIIEPYKDFKIKTSEYLPYLFAIDFNGDSLLDIFYQGPSGAEATLTQIFLNQGNHFSKVFSGHQIIVSMNFEKNKLHSFKINNPGCCADPEIVEYEYQIDYGADLPRFKLINTIGSITPTEKPFNKFVKGLDFEVQIDTAKLRTETYMLDKVHPVMWPDGNTICKYKKGSKGIALASKYSQNRLWIYVLMKTNITKSEWPTFIEQPTQMYGWLEKSATDLK